MSSEIDIAQPNEENPLGDSLFAQLVESIQESVVKKVNNPDQSSNDGKPNQDSESDDGEIKESDNESDLEKLGQAKKAKKRKKDHKKHKKKDHKRDKGEKKSKKSSDKSKSWYDLGEYEPNSKSKSYVSEENAVKPSRRRRSASVSSAGSTSKIRRSKSRERDDSSRKRAKLSPPEVPRSKLVVKERSEERDNRLYSEHRSVSQARSPPRRTSNRERDSHRSENSYYRSSYDPYYREPRSDNRWYYKDRKSSTRSVSTCSRRTRTPRSVAEKIDKAKLLAIARENLAKMIKEGTLPKGAPVDKFKLRHLKELSAADSVHQYAEFCRAISAMEAAAYSDSSLSGSDIDSDDEVRSVISQVTFDGRHPFALKERKDIQIKIRNLPQIQARSAKEVQSELRSEFPVSSGNMHKHKQLEWKEVEQPGPLALMPPPMAPPPKTKKTRTQEYPPPFAPPPEAEQPTTSGSTADSEVQPSKQTMDIGSIMAARISAMRVLEQDPQNAVALKQMEQANEMVTFHARAA